MMKAVAMYVLHFAQSDKVAHPKDVSHMCLPIVFAPPSKESVCNFHPDAVIQQGGSSRAEALLQPCNFPSLLACITYGR